MTTKQIQHLLAYLGYDIAPDGKYGPQTTQAVRDFQLEYGWLSVDGKAGEKTQAALKKAVGDGWERPEKDFWEGIEYFTRDEFRCTCGGRYCNGFPVEPDPEMVKTVNQIRKHFGKPFTPNSAIRCTKRNAEVGGAKNSQHLSGTACDITVPGVAPEVVAAYAETLLPDTGGIGVYDWGIHVDTRKTKARWNG